MLHTPFDFGLKSRRWIGKLAWSSLVCAVLLLATVPLQAKTQDAELYEKVRKTLVTLPRYSVFDNLEYKIENGAVTLLGQVRNASLHDDAERSVKRIKGVTSVTNNIEILPVGRNDDQIRREAFSRVYSGILARYKIQAVPPIHIIVKNGHLTLAGVVATKAESNFAEIQAKQVTFAFSVTNRLAIEEESK
ncbi:MAG: BON domain-containing protein [Blastocatellia bacterium]|nr:BON domain-containing protein [Blastocatellia bacterium]